MMNNDKGMNSSPLRMKPYLSEKVVTRKKPKSKLRDDMTPPIGKPSRPRQKLPNSPSGKIGKQVLPGRRKSTSRTGNRGR